MGYLSSITIIMIYRYRDTSTTFIDVYSQEELAELMEEDFYVITIIEDDPSTREE